MIFPLNEKERIAVKGMSGYWDEVRGREDKSPLNQEVVYVCQQLGPKVLDLITYALWAEKELNKK